MELEAPLPASYLVGAAIMLAGVVLPLAYMIFRSKRSPSSSSSVASSSITPSSSSFSKQTYVSAFLHSPLTTIAKVLVAAVFARRAAQSASNGAVNDHTPSPAPTESTIMKDYCKAGEVCAAHEVLELS